MKRVLIILAILVSTASLAFSQGPVGKVRFQVIIGNLKPNHYEANLMAAEENNHPNITKSIHDLQDAMQHLHEAPDEFGGHKAQAEADLKQAYISLRKALYYRIYEDTH
jgi:hypothetical protein